MVGLGVDKLGNHLALSLHAAMQPPEKREVERAWGQCGRTRCVLLACLATALHMWAPGWSWVFATAVLGPVGSVGYAFFYFL
jgi:hypothetical protein